MEHEVEKKGVVVARASTVVVWFDYQRGRYDYLKSCFANARRVRWIARSIP